MNGDDITVEGPILDSDSEFVSECGHCKERVDRVTRAQNQVQADPTVFKLRVDCSDLTVPTADTPATAKMQLTAFSQEGEAGAIKPIDLGTEKVVFCRVAVAKAYAGQKNAKSRT